MLPIPRLPQPRFTAPPQTTCVENLLAVDADAHRKYASGTVEAIFVDVMKTGKWLCRWLPKKVETPREQWGNVHSFDLEDRGFCCSRDIEERSQPPRGLLPLWLPRKKGFSHFWPVLWHLCRGCKGAWNSLYEWIINTLKDQYIW